VRQVKQAFDGAVWAVVRLAADEMTFDFSAWFDAADAVLVDAKVPGGLGGTGVALPWDRLRDSIERSRHGRPLVVAGGLTPDNVASAVAALSPDVVDVSSGVESAVGVKHHARMSEFVESVRRADTTARMRTGESVRT
jgi:phosphoribosylanthranilate isomerase